MFTIGWDCKAMIWDMASGEVEQTFVNDGVKFHICALSPDDKMAAATDYKGNLHLYDLVAKKQMFKVNPTNIQKTILDLAFTTDTSKIVIGGHNTCVFDIEERKVTIEL